MKFEVATINNRWDLLLPDFRMAFHRDRPKWEAGRLAHCADHIESGMTVFDVGAECGDFTTLYKTWVGSKGDVIPIEPAAHQWPIIRETIEANHLPAPELTFVGLIGDTSQEGRFLDEGWPPEAFGEGIPDGGFKHLKHDIDLPQTTIDDICSWVIPDVIVLDIEGAEWHALAGADYTLGERRPQVYVSVHDVPTDDWRGSLFEWYRKTIEDINKLMNDFDYTVEELPWFGEAERFFYYEAQ